MDKSTPSYNLSVVVRETGIKPDTLRAWERRYGLPDPERTEGGHRLYSARDIEMIKWFIARQDEGMRISHAVTMWEEMIGDGVDPLHPTPQRVDIQGDVDYFSEDAAMIRLRETWIEACLNFDEFAAEQILAQAFARYPVQLVVTEVLQKGMAQVGEAWYQAEVSVQQEHFISALVQRRMNALIAAAPVPTLNERILVGCPPGEQHVISPLITALMLRYHGWDVTYLGANVPLANLKETIAKISPDLVVYTATQLVTAASLRQVAEALKKDGIKFAFGGRIFSLNQSLVERIPGYYLGADLTRVAENAAKVMNDRSTGNTGVDLSTAYQNAYQQFEAVVMPLNSKLLDHYHGDFEMAETIREVNDRFAANILAGLTLGDLNLVNPEIGWVRTLIGNRGVPDDLLVEYLSVYRKYLAEYMNGEGEIILTWFDSLH